jgi:hypothetical protein
MQTSISIDSQTRDRAAERAKAERMPLAAVVRILLTDYAEGSIDIGTRVPRVLDVQDIAVDASTQKKMSAVAKKWRDRVGK